MSLILCSIRDINTMEIYEKYGILLKECKNYLTIHIISTDFDNKLDWIFRVFCICWHPCANKHLILSYESILSYGYPFDSFLQFSCLSILFTRYRLRGRISLRLEGKRVLSRKSNYLSVSPTNDSLLGFHSYSVNVFFIIKEW